MEIRVVKVPLGPAPEEVKTKWLGVQMVAGRMPTEGIAGAPSVEVNFISGGQMASRGGFVVSVEIALTALAAKSSEAADWFRQYLPAGTQWFSFGSDEAEVVV